MLSPDDFRPLKLEDKRLFLEFFRNYEPRHSDLSFGNLFAWRHYASYQLLELERHILLRTFIGERHQLCYPLGPNDAGLMNDLLRLAEELEAEPRVQLIDSRAQAFLQDTFPKLELKDCRDCADYVYESRKLAKLPGKDFLKHRNQINKFKRSYKYVFEEISPENFGELMAFLERWCLWKDCEGNPTLEAEKTALLEVLKHFDELELEGLLLRVEGDIQGMTVYEAATSDTAIVHYEKADPGFDGIYQVINQETAKRLQKRFTFINREHDLGVPGLRTAKTRYRPHHMVQVYRIGQEEEEKWSG